jgi:GNAT superfamily N-acetyltransferase
MLAVTDKLETVPTLSELVIAWGRGWAVSRGVPEPVKIPGGFRADVGLHGHRVRYVLHTWDTESAGSLTRQADAPGNWIKVAGSSEDLHSALPARWVPDSAGHLMTVRFAGTTSAAPPPYRTRVTTDHDIVVATVIDVDGSPVASGRLAPAGRYGIVDQVETAPAHRRRGLGAVVMRALSTHAARTGRDTGVLVATEEGRHLYRSLGWTVRSEIAAAHVPEA